MELYIFSNSGQNLYHFQKQIGDTPSKQSSFKITIPNFLKATTPYIQGLPKNESVSAIRTHGLEARFTSGKDIFTILILYSNNPLGHSTESILMGLLRDITDKFESQCAGKIQTISNSQFDPTVDQIIESYGFEAFELYQKLLLIEALYERIPQNLIEPLIEKVSQGEDVMEELHGWTERWGERLKNAAMKVNNEAKVIWELFSIPIYEVNQ